MNMASGAWRARPRIESALIGLATGAVLVMALLSQLPASPVSLAEELPSAAPVAANSNADAIATVTMLVERLDTAHTLMLQLRVVDNPATSHELAAAILDQITGPHGRYATGGALSPGVLPADGESAVDEPGLALLAFDATDRNDVQREIADTILGDIDRWRRPAQRWDDIDRVLAAWRPDRNTMPQLDGHLMRVIGWCALTLRSDSAKEARGYASHGQLHTGLSLEAARRAQAALDRPDDAPTP